MEDYSNIWALIKDNKVVNTILFTGEEPAFIEGLKLSMGVDDVISGKGSSVRPGIDMTYDYEENKFVP